ncbi:MAG: hypothetical protein O2958_06735 [Gemmatimonadetes bacterium]|nr:hypothetical protein [Gemmatimonadota bacterium]MDA1103152.1 hypothetical protein [Gemmatimonadota bacterium]
MERDELLERAIALGEDEDWQGAADLLREYLDDFDDDPAVHCSLGVAERELGMEGVAYERFKRALALEPVDPYVLATAGSGLAYFDDPDAETALRAAALTAPHLVVGRLAYGAYLAREGLLEDALRELLAAREIDADDPQIAYELGVAYALAEDYDLSTDALADAVRLDPDDGWSRTVLGLVLVEADRVEEGTAELIAGARRGEDDLDAHLLAALAASATGREEWAYVMLERARLNATEDDLGMVSSVEDRLEAGHEASESMLLEEFAPKILRMRLHARP